MAKTTKERLINSLSKAQLIRSADRGKSYGINSYFQQQAISGADLNDVYGNEKDFLERYSAFQKRYEQALDTQLNSRRAAGRNVELMKRRGTIDLNVLNKKAQEELYQEYQKLMGVERLLAKVGAPAIEIPSGNLYRKAFKFRVDQSSGVTHPAQLLLNRLMVNYNPNGEGLSSLSIGRSNIMSFGTVERLYQEGQARRASGGISQIFSPAADPNAGLRRILTFDVETTGVFQGSEVRSLSVAEMFVDAQGNIAGKPQVLPQFNIGISSSQLGGITVGDANGGVRTMTEFLADIEGQKKVLKTGQGGTEILDTMADFFETLNRADYVTGHNIGFDIDALINSTMRMPGFGDHRIGGEINKFLDRRDKGNYLVDTLEEARSFLMGEVEGVISQSGLTDIDQISKKYITSLYSQDILANVHMGGSAAFGSMENIALNTNLFELLEKDGQAEELFKTITKGSHVAETDVLLQSYVGKYIHEGRLHILDVARQNDPGFGIDDAGRFFRSKILQSQAITPTTNIADVSHMTSTLFDSLQEKDVTVRIAGDRIQGAGIGGEGILRYIGRAEQQQDLFSNLNEGYYFISQGPQGQLSTQAVDEGLAQSTIRSVLENARRGESGVTTPIKVGSTVKNVNMDAASIIDTGWSYGRASALTEMSHIQGVRAGAGGVPVTEGVVDTFREFYKQLGVPASPTDRMNAFAQRSTYRPAFLTGLNNYSLDQAKNIAQKFANIGDPFAGISMQDRVFSTIVAEATSPIMEEASRAGARAGYELADIAFSGMSQVSTGLGIGTFRAQKTARLFGSGAAKVSDVSDVFAGKVILPTNVVQKAATEAFGEDYALKNIGLSVASKGDERLVNAVWMANRELTSDQAKTLAEKILENFSTAEKLAETMGIDVADLDKETKEVISTYNSIKFNGKVTDLEQQLADRIMETNIVMGNAGEASESIIMGLEAAGIPTDNDIILAQRQAQIARTGLTEDYITLTPFVDEKVAQTADAAKAAAAGAQGVISSGQRSADEAIKNANRIATEISDNPADARVVLSRLGKIKDGYEASKVVDFYNYHKPKFGMALGAVAALSAGYYVAKKHRERQLYDETLEQQPTERTPTTRMYNDFSGQFSSMESTRRDPLATAGVVGNLDRRRTGHTQMGPRKYDHLFGG